jgi:hypothetical protein
LIDDIGICAGMVYPLGMVAGLNRAHLPNYWYQCYLQKQFQLRSFANQQATVDHANAHANGHAPLLEDGLRSS